MVSQRQTYQVVNVNLAGDIRAGDLVWWCWETPPDVRVVLRPAQNIPEEWYPAQGNFETSILMVWDSRTRAVTQIYPQDQRVQNVLVVCRLLPEVSGPLAT